MVKSPPFHEMTSQDIPHFTSTQKAPLNSSMSKGKVNRRDYEDPRFIDLSNTVQPSIDLSIEEYYSQKVQGSAR